MAHLAAPRLWCSRLVVATCLLTVAAAAQAEPVTAVRFSGSGANRVDVVILGDGYTAAEIASGKYATDIETFVQRVFAQEPYLEYQAYFNVRRVDVTSVESGSDHPELGTARNTALDGTYNCSGIQRLVCINLTKVNDVLSRSALAPTEKDIILVVVNDTTYGGSGGSIAVSSTNVSSAEIILHELGHSFGLLADEYGGPPPPACNSAVEPAAVNATRATTRGTIKWNHWIDAGTAIPTLSFTNGVPGLYAGAAYCDAGLYRPTLDSKMRS
ncbi:MAG: M64 family metallopeptidase, partial [Vicinamibacterales bacterium]